MQALPGKGVPTYVAVPETKEKTGIEQKHNSQAQPGYTLANMGRRLVTQQFDKIKLKAESCFKGICHRGGNILQRTVFGGAITGGAGAVAVGCAVFLTSFVAATPAVAFVAGITAGLAVAGPCSVPGLIGGACKPLIERAIVRWYVQPALEKQAKELKGSV